MPNHDNICRPVIVLGCGRTASSYVLDRLRHGQGSFQPVIENDIYRDVWGALTDRWWSEGWRHVAEPEERDRRIVAAVREVLCVAFPSDLPHWAMKMIWAGHDPDVAERLFPHARYLHLTRDPRTNVPSMIERLQFANRRAQDSYLQANDNALQFARFDGRYLQVRQEDLIAERTASWAAICAFLGVEPPPPEKWQREINTSASTSGDVAKMRADSRLPWRKLRRETRAMAERLGYRERDDGRR